jgi:RecA/RadA recombinase
MAKKKDDAQVVEQTLEETPTASRQIEIKNKFRILSRPEAKPISSKSFDDFLLKAKAKETTKLGVKISRLDEVINSRINDEHRRKFISGIVPWDLQLAVRDIDGNVIQIGDAEGIHILFSKPQQGKTMSMLTKAAQMQKNGLRGLLIFSEQEGAEELQTLARMAGLDTSKIGFTFETKMENIYTLIEDAIGNKGGAEKKASVDFIIVDSFDTLVTDAETKKGSAEDDMAIGARRSSRFLRIHHKQLCEQGIRLYLIFQYRSSIGTTSEYNIDNYAGGYAWKHYAKTITYVRRAGTSNLRDKGERFKVKQNENIAGVSSTGFRISMKLLKTKVSGALEGSTSFFDFYHMRGIDKIGTMFETALENKLIEQPSVAMYKFLDQTVRGVDNAKNEFMHNKEWQEEIEIKLIDKLRFHNISFKFDDGTNSSTIAVIDDIGDENLDTN